MNQARKRLIGNKPLADGEEGSISLEIEVFYEQGGISYRGAERKRGYYLLVVPVLYDKIKGETTYQASLGVVKRIDAAERFSPKKLGTMVPRQKDINQLVKIVKKKIKNRIKI